MLDPEVVLGKLFKINFTATSNNLTYFPIQITKLAWTVTLDCLFIPEEKLQCFKVFKAKLLSASSP